MAAFQVQQNGRSGIPACQQENWECVQACLPAQAPALSLVNVDLLPKDERHDLLSLPVCTSQREQLPLC